MSVLTGLLISIIIIVLITIIYSSRYKKIKKNKKKLVTTIFIILVILLFIGIPLLYLFIETKIVNTYYSTKECGHLGSGINFVNKECGCFGLKFTDMTIGSSKSVCLGECRSCVCTMRNSTSPKREVVNC